MQEEVTPRAVQLIAIDQNKQLKLMEEGVQIIQKFSQQCKNFAVIVVVGKYRTGKSYLVNQVLLQRSDGFNVGSTINACTKGLWMWSELVYFQSSKTNEPIPTIILDTEGIGSVEEEINHDLKIFLLAMLLSSYFIYNSVGTIDEMALQNLGLIVNLAKLLQKANEKDQKDIFESFPAFLWVLRDFTLKLEDEIGNRITPKEYLENALRPLKGFSETIENKNKIRRHITQFFTDRDCFTLVRPVQDEKALQKLSQLNLNSLRTEFQEQVQNLRKKFSYKVHLKHYKGKPITPFGFLEMCKHFVQALNSGCIPQIESQWQSICKMEMVRVKDECLKLYDIELENFMVQSGINKVQLEIRHTLVAKKMKDHLQQNCLENQTTEFKETKKLMKAELEEKQKYYMNKLMFQKDQELENLRETLIQQMQEVQSGKIWDVGEQAQHALLEFIFQGGDGDHLKKFIHDLWSELIKILHREILVYKHQINASSQEIDRYRVQIEESNTEKNYILETQSIKNKDYEIQLVTLKHQIQELSKEKTELTQEIQKITQIYQLKEEEYKVKLQKLELTRLEQLNLKDTTQKNMEVRLRKTLEDIDKILALQEKQEQINSQELEELRYENERIQQELEEHKFLVQKLRETQLINQDKSGSHKKKKSEIFINELEGKLSSTKKDSDKYFSEWRQQKHFLQTQLRQAQQQLNDHKKFNQTMISTLQSTRSRSNTNSNFFEEQYNKILNQLGISRDI